MKFWDSSAIVALLLDEPGSPDVADVLQSDQQMTVWWGTAVECAAALAARRRGNSIGDDEQSRAERELALMSDVWTEIEPFVAIRRTAIEVIRRHPLRAADSLQLAAALVAVDGDPGALPFVALDSRLAEAARQEGFATLP